MRYSVKTTESSTEGRLAMVHKPADDSMAMHPSFKGTATQQTVLPVLTSKTETRAFYNRISGVYDLLAERTQRPVRQVGLDLLAARPGEHLLEVGFGTGHCLIELAKAVGPKGRVYGVDIAEAMADLSLRLAEKERVGHIVHPICGDAENLPLPTDSVDGIFMSFVLELFNTPDIPVVLKECKRVLKVGGRIAIVALSKETQGSLVRAFEWTHLHFPNLVNCRPIFVRRALEEAGYLVRETLHKRMWVPVEIVLAQPAR